MYNPWRPTGHFSVGIRGTGLAVGIVVLLAFIDAKFGPYTSTTPHSQPGDRDSTAFRSPGNLWEAWKSTGTVWKALVSEFVVFKQDAINWAYRIDVSTCITVAIFTGIYAYERRHNGPIWSRLFHFWHGPAGNRAYSLLTYMFVHYDTGHFRSNARNAVRFLPLHTLVFDGDQLHSVAIFVTSGMIAGYVLRLTKLSRYVTPTTCMAGWSCAMFAT
jgi:membrane associated rhomboid family serine protease